MNSWLMISGGEINVWWREARAGITYVRGDSAPAVNRRQLRDGLMWGWIQVSRMTYVVIF